MSLSDFEAHLMHPAPGFRCYACRARTETLTFLARVKNCVNPPASPHALSSIDQLFGPAATTSKQFYANHDGVLMYEDSLPAPWSRGTFKAAGIRLFSVGELDEKSMAMRESLLAMGWSKEDMPGWLLQGIAIGEIPHSANYFVIQPTGENAGQVFYANHDAFEPDPIAGSFEKLLDIILADPAKFLNRHGSYTRYSDGQTNIQWIPKEYVASV